MTGRRRWSGRTETPGGKALREFVSAVAGGILVIDESGRVVLCNPAAAELFDRPTDGLVGAEVGFPLVANQISEIDVVLPEGASRPLEMRVTETSWGTHRAYVAAVRDLSERRAAANALEESEERFRKVFDESPIGLAVVDAELRMLQVNKALVGLLEYGPEELTRLSYADLFLPDDLHADADSIRDVLHGGTHVHQLEKRFVSRSGPVIWVQLTASILKRPPGAPLRAIVIVEDITQRKEAHVLLAHLAVHDELTGLANRTLAMDRIELAQARADRSGQFVAVLFLDFDRFKAVNDTLGHAGGDRLLVESARRLRSVLRPADTAARLGGDEFVVCCEDLGCEEAVARSAAIAVAQRIAGALSEPVQTERGPAQVTASIGIALAEGSQLPAELLLRHADAAMYRAKAEGSAGYKVFDEAHQARAIERTDAVAALRRALERDELLLMYQPIMNLQERRIMGAEALVRWDHPGRGLLLPEAFLDVAEESGLIVPMGDWVIRQACQQLLEWRRLMNPDLIVTVNASARQLGRNELVASVSDALAETKLNPNALHIELTESTLIKATASTLAELDSLRRLGVHLGLDDFGTGYASLTYLQRLPVDFVKIDGSFVAEIDQSTADHAIVQAVVGLGRALGLSVVAEGVETEGQMTTLQAMGCNLAQGWHLGYPQMPRTLEGLLTGHGSSSAWPPVEH